MDEAWRLWGPYLAERAWGTVREDYSANGDAWSYVTHDQARSYTYRWSEDGLAGISDVEQRLCFAFAFWNGRDPILKERIFGLSGHEGNHGEDAKELWWYLDATPDSSWLAWRYLYPHAAFPYEALVAENARRSRAEPEYELADTGVLDQGVWIIDFAYAKAAPDDLCIHLTARNSSPAPGTLHVLPTLWFRNTWGWSDEPKPILRDEDGAIAGRHDTLGRYVLAGDGNPELVFCDNEPNARRLWGVDGVPFPKDGIGDHVVHGAPTVNPDCVGTKAALRYRLEVAPGAVAELRLRLAPERRPLDEDWERTVAARAKGADSLYDRFGVNGDRGRVLRQALAGMQWSKQYFHYDVERWLAGDEGRPPPPAARRNGRNAGWTHLVNADVVSMPDKWEYPWYAAWDLAFHTLPLALVDPEFAKRQLLLPGDPRFMHPNGQLPAYEWNFSDVNPPVHAWAAFRVFELDGSTDFAFLERMLHKLLLNFTWWVNREDSQGFNVFSGGFLGLDNISPINRSMLPPGALLEQSDATGWMARYCIDLLRIAVVLGRRNPAYEDLAVKFALHFAVIATALDELWDTTDGFYYDRLRLSDGSWQPLRVRSAVGLIPLLAGTRLGNEDLERLPSLARALDRVEAVKPRLARAIARDEDGRVLAAVPPDRIRSLLARMFDEEEFLSPYGLRSLSLAHRDHPFELDVDGVRAGVEYEPAESTTPLYGGNSNWRGPIWMPLNYLAVEALRAYDMGSGATLRVELPARSGREVPLAAAADDLARRLISIFAPGADGRRPVHRSYGHLQDEPGFRELIPFHEYFHADTGAGLGASHQTGWTGLLAMLLANGQSGADTSTTALRPSARYEPSVTNGSEPGSDASSGAGSDVSKARRQARPSRGGSSKSSVASSMFKMT
jgi:Glycosyl hydrolase family 63 C-terminal domain